MRKRGVERNGSECLMERKLFRAQKMNPIGRHRRKARASAKGQGLVHENPRGQFNVEVGRGVTFPDRKSWEVV